MSDIKEQIKKLQNVYSDIFEIKSNEQIEFAREKNGIAPIEVINEHLAIAQGLRLASYYMKNDEFPNIY